MAKLRALWLVLVMWCPVPQLCEAQSLFSQTSQLFNNAPRQAFNFLQQQIQTLTNSNSNAQSMRAPGPSQHMFQSQSQSQQQSGGGGSMFQQQQQVRRPILQQQQRLIPPIGQQQQQQMMQSPYRNNIIVQQQSFNEYPYKPRKTSILQRWPETRAQREFRLTELKTTSVIRLRHASTSCWASMQNKETEPLTVVLDFHLPTDAVITGFTMSINNDTVVSRVVKTASLQDAVDNLDDDESTVNSTVIRGYVRKQRDLHVFSVVAELSADARAHVRLDHEQVLRRVDGLYKHVIDVLPRSPVDRVDVGVRIVEPRNISRLHVPLFSQKLNRLSNGDLLNLQADERAEIIADDNDQVSERNIRFSLTNTNDTGEIKNGQLVILYDDDRTDGAELYTHGEYLAHFFVPMDISEVSDRHICFVLDKSGSMSGRKMQQVKDSMRVLLHQLTEADWFSLVIFDDELVSSEPLAAAESIVKKQLQFLNDIDAAGSTDLHGGIRAGLQMLNANLSRADTLTKLIVFLTDGQPTAGVEDADEIRASLRQLNAKRYALHGISLGDDADVALVRSIAAEHNGLAVEVYESADTDLQLKNFIRSVSAVLLRDVQALYTGAVVNTSSLVAPSEGHSLNLGGEFTAFGRLKEANVSFDGIVSGGAYVDKAIERRAYSVILKTASQRLPDQLLCSTNCFADEDDDTQQLLDDEEPTPVADTNMTVHANVLERLYVLSRLQQLQTSLSKCAEEQCESIENSITQLAVEFGLVVDQTSLAANNNDELVFFTVKDDETEISLPEPPSKNVLTDCESELVVLVHSQSTGSISDRLANLSDVDTSQGRFDCYNLVTEDDRVGPGELVQLNVANSWQTLNKDNDTEFSRKKLPADFLLANYGGQQSILLLTDETSRFSSQLESNLKAARTSTGSRIAALLDNSQKKGASNRFSYGKATQLIDTLGASDLVADSQQQGNIGALFANLGSKSSTG